MKKISNHSSAIIKVRKFISISACFCMIASNAILAPAGNYDQPYHRTPCDDGACIPHRPTNGYHATKWRAWPGSESSAPVNKSNVRTPHGVPILETPPPKTELDHPAPPPSPFAQPQDQGNPGSQPAPSAEPGQPGSQTPPGPRDNIPNFKAPPRDPADLGNPASNPLGSPAISMSYNKDLSDSSNSPADQAPPRNQNSGLKILPHDRFNEPASAPIKRLPSNSTQFQNDRSDVEKLLDNGPRFRNVNDSQSSITPEDLEQNDRPEIIQGETVRISMNNARTTLNIQEPKNEPNRRPSRDTTPAISTAIQRTSANSPAMTPRISVPSTNNSLNNQPIQRADFNSVGNDSTVTPLNHYAPVMNEIKVATQGNDLMKEYQSATLKIVQSPASNPSTSGTQFNSGTQMSSVQFAQAKTVSYQSNSTPASLPTFNTNQAINSGPAISAPIFSAPPIDTTVRVAPPSNPLRGVPAGNPLRRN